MTTPSDRTEDHRRRRGDRKELTRGAGLALAGRLGALIEVVSFPLFLWLYGPVTFGIYATFWAVVRIGTGLTGMGMDVALQRFVPALADERQVHRVVAVALAVSGAAGISGALAISFAAPYLEPFAYGAGDDSADIVAVIRLYAWSLPLWTMVEILTACVRARRAFGPEIRIRFFYEQILRILFAILFVVAGLATYGLFLAHLLSLAVAAGMALLLVRRFYRLSQIVTAGVDRKLVGRMLDFALPMMPTTLIQRFFSELPVVLLNLALPGATGATAAGYYSIARKISSVLQVIYHSFDYVLAPLAAFRAGATGSQSVADMYAYSTRLMIAIGLVAGGAMIAARNAFLLLLGADGAHVLSALVILILGRMLTFLFGQAPAIIRTLGSSYWSLGNGVLGLALMVSVLVIGVDPGDPPSFALATAALAAASGMVVAAGLAALEVGLLYRMSPYSRDMLRPLAVALALAGALLIAGEVLRGLPAALQFAALVPALLLSLAGLLRYGLSGEDAAAFGRLGRRLRRGRGG